MHKEEFGIFSFLEYLASKKVKLENRDQNISITAPQGALTQEDIAYFKQHKDTLLLVLEEHSFDQVLSRRDVQPVSIPLTELQKSLAGSSTVIGGSAFHQLSFTVHKTQVDQVEKTYYTLVEQYAILRAYLSQSAQGEHLLQVGAQLANEPLPKLSGITQENLLDLVRFDTSNIKVCCALWQPVDEQHVEFVLALHGLIADTSTVSLIAEQFLNCSATVHPLSKTSLASIWPSYFSEQLQNSSAPLLNAPNDNVVSGYCFSEQISTGLSFATLKQLADKANTTSEMVLSALVESTLVSGLDNKNVALVCRSGLRDLITQGVDVSNDIAGVELGYLWQINAQERSPVWQTLKHLKLDAHDKANRDRSVFGGACPHENALAVVVSYLECAPKFSDQIQLRHISPSVVADVAHNIKNKVHVSAFCGNDELVLALHASEKDALTKLVSAFKSEFLNQAQSLCANYNKAILASDTNAELSEDQLERLVTLYPQMESVHRITPLQHGIYFESLINRSAYVSVGSINMTGDVDIERLHSAYQHVVQCASALRTVFTDINSEVIHQVVLSKVVSGFEYVDLSVTDEPHTHISQHIEQHKALDLNSGPLTKLSVFKLDDEHYHVAFIAHHIVLDGWSQRLFMDQLWDNYFNKGKGLAEREIPAKVYSKWLSEKPLDDSKRYWQDQVGGFNTPTSLNIELPIEVQSKAREQVTLSLDGQQSSQLYTAAKSMSVTPNALLSACWSYLLHRYSGDSKVVFGTVVAGRPAEVEGIENMLGMFMNTLPIVSKIPNEGSMAQWVVALQGQQAERERHSSLPIQEVTKLSGVTNGVALFNTLLVVQNMPSSQAGASEDKSLTLSDFQMEESSHYPISLDIVTSDNIHMYFKYDSGRYAHEDLNKLANIYRQLLLDVTANPHIMLNEIDILSEADKQLQSEWAKQNTLDLPALCPHDIISRTSAQYADKVALICEQEKVTYAQLESYSNRLANHLQQYISGPDEGLIALVMPRGIPLVLSILATWKLGKGYVPVDPELPAQRIASMLEDAQVELVVSAVEWESLAVEWQGQVTPFNESILIDETISAKKIDKTVSVDSLSYVIFTSGSTGKPKGAQVEHIGALNHMLNKVEDLRMNTQSRLVQNASQNFDISVWQMFCPLLVGGTTYIYTQDKVLDIDRFVDSLQTDKISILEVVPSYLGLLLDQLEARDIKALPTLEFLMVTGETLDAFLLKKWFGKFSHIPVFNAYGPTEASDDITHHLATAENLTDTVPIGKTLKNFDIYIVDPAMRVVPHGVKGEIVVSGVGVGRGYINNPEKTAAAFMTSPFVDHYKQRLYKTGDIGRYAKDGTIEFFGRKDKQVKIHGYRIELEEIEKHLKLLSGIKNAVVLDVNQPEKGTILVAHLESNEELDNKAILSQLRRVLPFYMIPNVVMTHKQLPLNKSGKLDRPKLLAMDISLVMSDSKVKPSTPTQIKLAEVWQEVLKEQELGVNDNYFALGGDSFKAIQIAAKFGGGLSVVNIYDYPTIESLAEFVDENSDKLAQQTLQKLTKYTNKPKLTVIGISNSGGDAISFKDVASALDNKEVDIELYGLRLPRDKAPDDAAMMEAINSLTEQAVEFVKEHINTPILVFGQCNGSAMAISITYALQNANLPITGLMVGGALQRVKMTPRDTRSDTEVVDFLNSMGAPLPEDPAELNFFLKDFKYDTYLAQVFYNNQLVAIRNGQLSKLPLPLYCVTGTHDHLTKGYQHKFKHWLQISAEVMLVEYPDVGHYLLRDCPDELASTICQIYSETLRASDSSQSLSLIEKLRLKMAI
ncbi:amino acid adenylation domain-containing protein [Pseudoalteromonas sp. MMG013]|uniref:non-ribosomal peptide synthetase n=1 Tax=Pseudoalteromonas sp. MMG013 TaxID=2822687 RepID=UPI001B3616D7|nr:amino acid adenylation domain-containing protein [Pseudoalteromonas sp. MMG013]